MRITGIYAIKNIDTDKYYVGKSVYIEVRLKRHFRELREGIHHSKYLQNSFNKHGEDSFKPMILEECSEEVLFERERFWIDKLNAYKSGYNMTLGGGGVSGWVAPPEFKEKMKQVTQGEKNGNYGHYWSEEMKTKASERMLGRYSGEKNPRATKVFCVETMKVFNTLTEAAQSLGLKSGSSITRCLKDKTLLAGGFHFCKYDEETYNRLKNKKARKEYLKECSAAK